MKQMQILLQPSTGLHVETLKQEVSVSADHMTSFIFSIAQVQSQQQAER